MTKKLTKKKRKLSPKSEEEKLIDEKLYLTNAIIDKLNLKKNQDQTLINN